VRLRGRSARHCRRSSPPSLHPSPSPLTQPPLLRQRTLPPCPPRRRAPGNLQHFPNLETLILDKNGLPGLLGFARNANLRQLWFNNNAAEDLVDFCDQAAALFPGLVWLSLMRNPASPPLVCTSEEESAAAARYRLYVIYRLPGLQFLDAVQITRAERAEAAAKGQFMAARKPRPGTSGSAPLPSAGSSTLFGFLSGLGGGGGSGSSGSSGSSSGGGSGEAGAAGGSSGGSTAAAAGSSSGSSAGSAPKKPTAFIAVGRQEYNGRNSEGNRFISDKDL
jgi:hypothetical protein